MSAGVARLPALHSIALPLRSCTPCGESEGGCEPQGRAALRQASRYGPGPGVEGVAPGIEPPLPAARRRLELFRPGQAPPHRRTVERRCGEIDTGRGRVQQTGDAVPGGSAEGRGRGVRGRGETEGASQPLDVPVPLLESLEIDLPHLAPIDEKGFEAHSSRRTVETQPKLAAERARLDAGEDVLVHDPGPLVGCGKDAETDADGIRAQRVQERPGEQRDDRDDHREPATAARRPASHAARTARYRQPTASSASPSASAA